jgi:predicted nucleic acid-binding protein
MIVADTNTWIAFLSGKSGEDVSLLDKALADNQVLMAPVVLTELLSDPKLLPSVAKMLTTVPLVDIEFGCWERAGALRAGLLAKGRRARLGDTLIAQNCIDRAASLLTRDRDFRSFIEIPGLDLFIYSSDT